MWIYGNSSFNPDNGMEIFRVKKILRLNWKDLSINPNALNIQSLHSALSFFLPMSRTVHFYVCEMNTEKGGEPLS